MARPLKQGLDYFPYDIDLDQDDKLGMIIGEFGDKGERLYTKLLCWIYKHEGYYSGWNEDVQLRFLRRYTYCGFSMSFIEEAVPRFLKWGLFSKTVFDTLHILTSERIQKTWIDASRKRKDRIILEKVWLLSVTDGFKLEEIKLTAEETTQKESKVKEIKKKETKESNGVVPQHAGRKKKLAKPEIEKPPEPYWNKLVEVWFTFCKEKFSTEPSFKGQDPKTMLKIVIELKKRSKKNSVEWTEENATSSFKHFICSAYKDQWLKQHFLLKNLDEQFDKIIRPPVPEQADKPAIPVKKLSKLEKDINFMYESFMEGRIYINTMSSEHYELLRSEGMKFNTEQSAQIKKATDDYLKQENIESISEHGFTDLRKRFAMIEHFKILKQEGNAMVF